MPLTRARSGLARSGATRSGYPVDIGTRVFVSYAEAVLAIDDLLGYWRLNELSGTSALDSSGNGYNATYSGSPTLGVSGALAEGGASAATLDGIDDYITTPAGSFPTTASSFTVECWIKHVMSGGQRVVASTRDFGGSDYFGTIGGLMFWFSGGTDPSFVTGTGYNNGQWHHVCYVRESGTTRKIYVDGVLLATHSTDSGVTSGGTTRIRIGHEVGLAEFFQGSIDECAVYTRALTLAEIQDHYGRRVLTGTDRPAMYALSGVARSGATRSGHTSPRPFIALAGVHYGNARDNAAQKVMRDLSITDVLNHVPTTARLAMRGVIPTAGQDVVITIGSKNNLEREFAGVILSTQVTYDPKPTDWRTDCDCIDYTWGLNKRKVVGHYTGSATTIAQQLIAEYAAGYSDDGIVAGLPTVDGGITFTNEELADCFTRLAQRIGGYWYCDYTKVVHLFITQTAVSPPRIVNAVHPTLLSTGGVNFTVQRDLSQVVTRVYVEGGGGRAMSDILAGETQLPVDTILWYIISPGVVICGPQRITYTGILPGGGGSLVGPGAAPAAAPDVDFATGTGIESGTHEYAVTFVTAGGESIPSPRASITVGVVAAPATAPTAGNPTVGTGPDPGTHEYAVTFVTASGETTAGPRVTKATSVTTPPASTPTPTLTVGTGIDNGAHDYAVSFVTSIGETTVGPISASVTTGPVYGPISPPASGPTANAAVGTGLNPGFYYYALTYYDASGQTTPGPTVGPFPTYALASDPSVAPSGGSTGGGGSLSAGKKYRWKYTFVQVSTGAETAPSPASAEFTASASFNRISYPIAGLTAPPANYQRRWYRTAGDGSTYLRVTSFTDDGTTFTDGSADGTLGAAAPATNNTQRLQMSLTALPIGPSGTTGRGIYRTVANGSALGHVTIIDNVATSYTDSTPDVSLGGAPPTTNTTSQPTNYNRVSLSGIPTGTSEVTSRKIYRRSGGLGLKLLTTIANNSTTTYTDSTPNASLGAAPPASNTAYLQRIPLTNLPVGGALVTHINIYGTAAGGSQLKFIVNLANGTTSYTVTTPDASLSTNVPTSNTATANRVTVSGIPIGAASVTQRKLYRTAVGSSQLKLLTTIADNTTTTYADSTADASLGANAPTSDTSGLTQPDGIVLAGSTSIIVAGTGWANPSGGWAVIGNGQQVIRYTGVSGSSLTGIPSTGAGAITATIAYSSNITAAPTLTGIPASGPGSIRHAIAKGDAVNQWVQVDDTAAQTALAAAVGGDGIQEHVIQDRRLTYDECVARGEAYLTLYGSPIVTVRYRTRDRNTRAGHTVTVNLGPPFNLFSVAFKIQRVTITQFSDTLDPLRTVEASSTRFSFEDVLRLARLAGSPT